MNDITAIDAYTLQLSFRNTLSLTGSLTKTFTLTGSGGAVYYLMNLDAIVIIPSGTFKIA